jgi:hypothetical protein
VLLLIKNTLIKTINYGKFMNLKKFLMISVMSSAASMSAVDLSSCRSGRYAEHYLTAYDNAFKSGSLRGIPFLASIGALLLPYTYCMKPNYAKAHYVCGGLSIIASLSMFFHSAYTIANTVHHKVAEEVRLNKHNNALSWSSALPIAASLTMRHCCGLPILNNTGETAQCAVARLRTTRNTLPDVEQKQRAASFSEQQETVIIKLHGRIKDLQTCRDEFQFAASSRGQDIEKLNKDLTELRAQYQQLQAKHENLQSQLSSRTLQYVLLDKQNKNYEKTIIERVAIYQEILNKNLALKAEIERMKKIITARIEEENRLSKMGQEEGVMNRNISLNNQPEGIPSHSSSPIIDSILISQPGLAPKRKNVVCMSCADSCQQCKAALNACPLTNCRPLSFAIHTDPTSGKLFTQCSHTPCPHLT